MARFDHRFYYLRCYGKEVPVAVLFLHCVVEVGMGTVFYPFVVGRLRYHEDFAQAVQADCCAGYQVFFIRRVSVSLAFLTLCTFGFSLASYVLHSGSLFTLQRLSQTTATAYSVGTYDYSSMKSSGRSGQWMFDFVVVVCLGRGGSAPLFQRRGQGCVGCRYTVQAFSW